MNDQQILLCISLHLPERMTVNHDVTGSSPVGGAKENSRLFNLLFFFCLSLIHYYGLEGEFFNLHSFVSYQSFIQLNIILFYY